MKKKASHLEIKDKVEEKIESEENETSRGNA